MFGYTVPMYARMSASDLSTYRRFYCETCHQLKAGYGLVSTSAVNYDMTFNTIVLNSVTGGASEMVRTTRSPFCVFKHPGSDSKLLHDMAAYTLLLTKWELYDDRVDKPSLKTDLIELTLGRAVSKAESEFPDYDKYVGDGFRKLRDMELKECTDAAAMGREFGKSLSEALGNIAGKNDTPQLRSLFTELTAAVYVMDAVDDLEQDFMDDTYNPLLADRRSFVNRDVYMKENLYSVTAMLRDVMESLQKAYLEVRKNMTCCVGVTDNVVFHGVTESAKKAVAGNSTAQASVKNILNGHKERSRRKRFRPVLQRDLRPQGSKSLQTSRTSTFFFVRAHVASPNTISA